jgi:hypothetical protein
MKRCASPPATPGVATVIAGCCGTYVETAGGAGDLKFGPTTQPVAISDPPSVKIDSRRDGTLQSPVMDWAIGGYESVGRDVIVLHYKGVNLLSAKSCLKQITLGQ